MSKNKFTSELILKADVRHLLDDFAVLMGLRAVFFSADGREIERGRDADCSEYCHLMQTERFGVEDCRKIDAEKRNECAAQGKIVSYICHAGLGEIVAPVIVFGKIIGYIMLGQFRCRWEMNKLTLKPHEKSAYEKLRCFNLDELGNLIHMFGMLVEYIVTHELVTTSCDVRMLQLELYVKRNLSCAITLKQAARHLACSESTLTHYLRREYHTTFCQFVTEKRLEAAEKMLQEKQAATLAEIAVECGFSDQHYFSRVFKAVRGYTPASVRRH